MGSKPLLSIKERDPKLREVEFAPDGRLMAVMSVEDDGKNCLDVIVNFVDEMRAKVDAAK